MQVDVGQDRLVGVGRHLAQFGEPLQRQRIDRQPVDVDLLVKIGERRPVHLGPVDGDERPLRVAHLDVAQHDRVVDRPLDPPDPIFAAILVLERGDPIGDETVSGP